VVNIDGTNLRRLTHHPAEDLLPAWSPDGQRIAFWSRRDDLWRLFVMNANGSEPYPLQLFANPGPRLSRPIWAPDGNLILFVILRDGNQELCDECR
jgi:TolB protein